MAEITIDGRDLMQSIKVGVRMPRAFGFRMWVATQLFRMAGVASGMSVSVEVDSDDYDPDDASTWVRHSEPTPQGGEIVLVRYPEGYRLRHHGETVWRDCRQPSDWNNSIG